MIKTLESRAEALPPKLAEESRVLKDSKDSHPVLACETYTGPSCFSCHSSSCYSVASNCYSAGRAKK